jgi:2-succinyl-5-enolpyruvyl-6-hydroxy-3-cyclohexene-1-carboxylate synthase
MILQPIVNIAQICAQKLLTYVVASPGSRCAPLTIAFARHPKIKTLTISDERSAAFIGIGIAQQLKHTVGLVCTSGSAAYNYAPAIAEAFYQHVPLLVLTADRPPEWIDQLDGQTIRQQEIYGKHVKKSFNLPVSYDHPDTVWQIERIMSEAINLSMTYPAGPVHVNIPLREPFYPAPEETLTYENNIKIISQVSSQPSINDQTWEALLKDWQKFDKKLIIGGQAGHASIPHEAILRLSSKTYTPVIGDVISNLHGLETSVRYPDIFLAQKDEKLLENLQPELLITYGKSVISKNLKIFLRKYKPKTHWHIQPNQEVADPFQTLTHIIEVHPDYFFENLAKKTEATPKASSKEYFKLWADQDSKARNYIEKFAQEETFGEFSALEKVMQKLPENSLLHLANSMSVRYANFIGLSPRQRGVEVFANRGTSGIDGSTSTALGAALANPNPVVLITGDMSFFYDRNALWNNYLPKNLRIVVLNNHAGGIFGLIDGPSRQPELEEFFETTQKLNAELTAKDFGMDYLYCNNFKELNNNLPDFFKMDQKAKILEIETDKNTNKQIFNKFKLLINKNYGT